MPQFRRASIARDRVGVGPKFGAEMHPPATKPSTRSSHHYHVPSDRPRSRGKAAASWKRAEAETSPSASSGPRSIRGRDDLAFDGNVIGVEAEVHREVLARGLDLVHGFG